MTSETEVNAEARVPRTVPTGQHAGRSCAQPRGLPDAPWELAGDVVPDVVRPALEHASPGHDVQTVTRRVSVRSEECWPVDRKEVDVGVLARLQHRLRYVYIASACANERNETARWEKERERTSNASLKSPIWFQLYQPQRPGL